MEVQKQLCTLQNQHIYYKCSEMNNNNKYLWTFVRSTYLQFYDSQLLSIVCRYTNVHRYIKFIMYEFINDFLKTKITLLLIMRDYYQKSK